MDTCKEKICHILKIFFEEVENAKKLNIVYGLVTVEAKSVQFLIRRFRSRILMSQMHHALEGQLSKTSIIPTKSIHFESGVVMESGSLKKTSSENGRDRCTMSRCKRWPSQAGKEGYAVLEEIGRESSTMSCFSTGQTLNSNQGERNCVLSGQQQGKHFDSVSPEGLRARLGGSYAFILQSRPGTKWLLTILVYGE